MTTATTRQPVVEDGLRYWPSKEGRRAPEDQMLNQWLIYLEDGIVVAIVYLQEGANGIADDGTGFEVAEAYYLNGEARPEYFEGQTMFDFADDWYGRALYPLWVVCINDQVWRVSDFRHDRAGASFFFATRQGIDEADMPHLQKDTVYARLSEGDDTVTSFDDLAKLIELPEGPEVKHYDYIADGSSFESWDEFYDAGNRLCIEDLKLS